MILVLKTDKPEVYFALFDNSEEVASVTWGANRTLSDHILQKLEELLLSQSINWPDLTGIVVFKGPGSFTGLRIGITVANTLAYSLEIPIVGSSDDQWVLDGIAELANGVNHKVVMPEYGAEANITQQKK